MLTQMCVCVDKHITVTLQWLIQGVKMENSEKRGHSLLYIFLHTVKEHILLL